MDAKPEQPTPIPAPTDPGQVRGLVPGPPLRGTPELPPSKSLGQRALLLGALVPGRTRVLGIPPDGGNEDLAATLGLLATLGRRPSWQGPRALTIEGSSPAGTGRIQPTGPLKVGESGTLARLATAVAALCCRGSVEVVGRGSLVRRRSPALFRALARAGARLEPEDRWPCEVRGLGPPPDLHLEHPSSSQELTALLLVAAVYPDPIEVHLTGALPSGPYVDLTRGLLATFGVTVTEHVDGDERRSFVVSGSPTAPHAPLRLEPDASAAAVALAAAAVTGGHVVVPGPWAASLQGDAEAPRFLAAFGALAERGAEALSCTGPVRQGAQLDLAGHPDLAPPLTVVAAAAAIRCGATSRLTGLGTLRTKESDRLVGLADGLTAVGLDVAIELDALVIGPPRGELCGATLDPRADHRMAFAFALLGLLVPGVQLTDPDVVAKSWPGFWTDLAALGARPQVRP